MIDCIFLSLLAAFMYGFWGTPVWLIIQMAFLALKLFGHVEWNWWHVLMPTWIGVAAVFGIWGFFVLTCS